MRKENRPDRLRYNMSIARLVAKRSTCTRAKVGAVLVDQNSNRLVATGYNGSIKGSPHCIDVGCLIVNKHCVRTVHAEMNAILHMEHNYPSLVLYCTHQPCYQCLKALLSVNVRAIYYHFSYTDEARDKILKDYNWNQTYSVRMHQVK